MKTAHKILTTSLVLSTLLLSGCGQTNDNKTQTSNTLPRTISTEDFASHGMQPFALGKQLRAVWGALTTDISSQADKLGIKTTFPSSLPSTVKHIQLFLDTDSNPDTGYSFSKGSIVGANYMIEDGNLYKSTSNTSWAWEYVVAFDGYTLSDTTLLMTGTNQAILSMIAENISELTMTFVPRDSQWKIVTANVSKHSAKVGLSSDIPDPKPEQPDDSPASETTIALLEHGITIDALFASTLPSNAKHTQIFINKDGNDSTGYSFGRGNKKIVGADFMIEDGALYRSTSNSKWSWEYVRQFDLYRSSDKGIMLKGFNDTLKEIVNPDATVALTLMARDEAWNILSDTISMQSVRVGKGAGQIPTDPPLATAHTTTSIKVAQTIDIKTHFTNVPSDAKHVQLFLDTDHNPITGYRFDKASIKGAEYLVEDHKLFKFAGGSGWNWTQLKDFDAEDFTAPDFSVSSSKATHKKILSQETISITSLLRNEAWKIIPSTISTQVVKADIKQAEPPKDDKPSENPSDFSALEKKINDANKKIEEEIEKKDKPIGGAKHVTVKLYYKANDYAYIATVESSNGNGSATYFGLFTLDELAYHSATNPYHKDSWNNQDIFSSYTRSPGHEQGEKAEFISFKDGIVKYRTPRDGVVSYDVKKSLLRHVQKNINVENEKERARAEEKDKPIGGAKEVTTKIHYKIDDNTYIATVESSNGNANAIYFGVFTLDELAYHKVLDSSDKDSLKNPNIFSVYQSSPGNEEGEKAEFISFKNGVVKYRIISVAPEFGDSISENVLDIQRIGMGVVAYDVKQKKVVEGLAFSLLKVKIKKIFSDDSNKEFISMRISPSTLGLLVLYHDRVSKKSGIEVYGLEDINNPKREKVFFSQEDNYEIVWIEKIRANGIVEYLLRGKANTPEAGKKKIVVYDYFHDKVLAGAESLTDVEKKLNDANEKFSVYLNGMLAKYFMVVTLHYKIDDSTYVATVRSGVNVGHYRTGIFKLDELDYLNFMKSYYKDTYTYDGSSFKRVESHVSETPNPNIFSTFETYLGTSKDGEKAMFISFKDDILKFHIISYRDGEPTEDWGIVSFDVKQKKVVEGAHLTLIK